MRICVVIQSEAFRTSAGMRIRYDRFRECLTDTDVSIEDITSAELAAAPRFEHDVYIFCKTFDTAALLLARKIRAAGKIVGQDLFDDYFSQHHDVRLARFREWLTDMAPVTHFAMCSTPRMVEVLRPYMPDVRITAIDDPIVGLDVNRIVSLAAAKGQRARESKIIDVVWFGIGDNPYFPVGLHDLAACEDELAVLQRAGWTVSLRIVTNRRAFEHGGAELLRRLSVAYQVVEWTEETESQELERATVALLPVSGQSFSRAKSLNRAVTALSAGCQVLSVGYPLYKRLDDYIYRSVDDVIADITNGHPRVSSASAAGLSAKLDSLSSPTEAARSFVREARTALKEAKGGIRGAPVVCLIHGRNSAMSLHKAVSAMKGLSVSTPFSIATWNFPVRFDIIDRELVMRVTPVLAKRHALPVKSELSERVGDLEFVTVDLTALGQATLPMHLRPAPVPIRDLAVYEDVMRTAENACRAAFAPADVLFSDTSLVRLRRSDLANERPNPWSKTVMDQPSAARSETSVDVDRGWAGTRAAVLPKRWTRLMGGKDAIKRVQMREVEASGLFDGEWYFREYPDVASSGTPALAHYFDLGWREGRDPGPHFSTKAYLKAHRDVAAQGLNPLLHYVSFGEVEGRRIEPSMRTRQQVQPAR